MIKHGCSLKACVTAGRVRFRIELRPNGIQPDHGVLYLYKEDKDEPTLILEQEAAARLGRAISNLVDASNLL